MQAKPEGTSGTTNDPNLSLLQLLSPEIIANPYGLYRALREHDPVYWDPYMHAWIVTSYQEVVNVLTAYSADRTPSPEYLEQLGLSFMKPFSQMMLRQMLFRDEEDMHARLRKICSAGMTSYKIESLKNKIQSIADGLIDKFIEKGQVDMVDEFANPFPAIVTATLLGVPVEDHRQLGAWVIDIAEVLGNFQHHPDRVAEIIASLEEMKSYVADKMAEQRKNPTGGLIYSLMTAEFEGDHLTDDEVIANTIVTLIGGHETTTNLIASGFLSLSRNPEAFELLRTHPEIAASAVEELLRYESPVQQTARIAPADMDLAGKSIRKSSRVVAVLAGANRDPNRFADPDRLDLLRSDNRHLTFGWAAHFCFGAPVARIEGQIAFNTLLRRLVNPEVYERDLQWRSNAGLRGLTALQVKFKPGRRETN